MRLAVNLLRAPIVFVVLGLVCLCAEATRLPNGVIWAELYVWFTRSSASTGSCLASLSLSFKLDTQSAWHSISCRFDVCCRKVDTSASTWQVT